MNHKFNYLITNEFVITVFLKGGGIISSPSDCHMVIRSFKTLAIRMEQHMKNAMEVAKFVESHPRIERVLYPGMTNYACRYTVHCTEKGN